MARNPIELRLTPHDISAIRFGLSPGMELAGAVRTLVDPGQHPLHWGWVRSIRGRVPAEPLKLLGALIGSDGYLPDFLTSTPGWDLTPDVELARLRDADPDALRRDLDKVIARSSARRRAVVEQLASSPARTRTVVADAWEEVWAALLEPQWPALERLLRADIGSRSRRIGEHGLAAMVNTLHDQVSWRGDTVEVAIPTHSQVIDCTGTGLMLVPSVFRRTCGVVGDTPSHPMLFYPAHGISETWHEQDPDDGAALTTLLGDGRARVLISLSEPLSTSETARACELAVSTTSHHLTVLRDAGLVDSRRAGRMVLHARTLVGDALLAAPTGSRGA